MEIRLSDGVMEEVLKLQAVEDGRLGNYSRIDGRIDKLRYHVGDLVLGVVFSELRKAQEAKKVSYRKN